MTHPENSFRFLQATRFTDSSTEFQVSGVTALQCLVSRVQDFGRVLVTSSISSPRFSQRGERLNFSGGEHESYWGGRVP